MIMDKVKGLVYIYMVSRRLFDTCWSISLADLKVWAEKLVHKRNPPGGGALFLFCRVD